MANDLNIAAIPEARNNAVEDESGKQRMIAAGGVLGAIAATTCCILPVVLTVLGVSGAWMVNLRAMAPYQPYVIAATLVFLGYGFYLVYWKPKKACADGAACARPLPNRLVQGSLWLASVIVLAATTFPLWFDYIVPFLP